jgi:pseudaminic acid synthase
MQETISIEDVKVGHNYPPFIIAEMSGNHNQSLERAIKIIDAAANAGAHAVKLQTYTAKTMTLDLKEREFLISGSGSLWEGNNLFDLYNQAHTPWEWHKPIFDHCRKVGLIPFSTPFDDSSVDFLEELGVSVYKIASGENIDLPLIEKVARTGKPIIMSTGMASIAELDEAVCKAREAGCRELILLKCTSTYPSSPKNTNLMTIPHMKNLFGVQVGISDHTMGIGVSIAATALGATVIEKHFTLNRKDGGVDSAFSLEPEELALLVEESKKAHAAIGEIQYGAVADEKISRKYRRSLYIAEDMKKGEELTERNLRSIRPGLGLSPKFYKTLLGKRINRNVKKGTPTNWELIG